MDPCHVDFSNTFLESIAPRQRPISLVTLQNTVLEVDAEFSAKAALYFRHALGLRRVPTIIASVLADKISHCPWATSFFSEVVFDATDAVELITHCRIMCRGPIPKYVTRGIAIALERSDIIELERERDRGIAEILKICAVKETLAIRAFRSGKPAPDFRTLRLHNVLHMLPWVAVNAPRDLGDLLKRLQNSACCLSDPLSPFALYEALRALKELPQLSMIMTGLSVVCDRAIKHYTLPGKTLVALAHATSVTAHTAAVVARSFRSELMFPDGKIISPGGPAIALPDTILLNSSGDLTCRSEFDRYCRVIIIADDGLPYFDYPGTAKTFYVNAAVPGGAGENRRGKIILPAFERPAEIISALEHGAETLASAIANVHIV